jgi:hypothetical protein
VIWFVLPVLDRLMELGDELNAMRDDDWAELPGCEFA